MATPSDKRKPKFAQPPPAQTIRTGGDPTTGDTATIAWHFHRLDDPHPTWGWSQLPAKQWKDVLKHLRAFEGLTWAKIKEQAGGKKSGTNHHSIPTEELTSEAQKRLADLRLDDCSSVFSLRLANTLRIYGIRDGRVLQLLWYDPCHGSKNGVCLTKKNK